MMAELYDVVNQEWMTTIGPGNRFIRQVEITATTKKGTTFRIDVPASQYDVNTVQALLEERAREIVAVENL